MDDAPDQNFIECNTYTRARRYPNVIGVIGGQTLPFGPYSMAQVAVAVISFALLFMSRGLWGDVIGSRNLRTFVMVGFPAGLMYAVRNLRPEGRSPFAFALGVAYAWTSPSTGRRHGRSQRPTIPTRAKQSLLLIERKEVQ